MVRRSKKDVKWHDVKLNDAPFKAITLYSLLIVVIVSSQCFYRWDQKFSGLNPQGSCENVYCLIALVIVGGTVTEVFLFLKCRFYSSRYSMPSGLLPMFTTIYSLPVAWAYCLPVAWAYCPVKAFFNLCLPFERCHCLILPSLDKFVCGHFE